MIPIPILMYHQVEDKEKGHKYLLDKKAFEEQLQYLYENGYRTLNTSEYLNLGRSNNSKNKYVILTFDDCYESYYSNVFPCLKKYKAKAIFFVTTDLIDTSEEYLKWSHLVEMNKEGMDIQSHTCSHKFLDGLNAQEIEGELYNSKYILEEKLGSNVNFFSCPGGRFNKKVIKIAKSTGYKGAFTSVPGYGCWENEGFLLVRRLLVNGNIDIENFAEILELNKVRLCIKKTKYNLKHLLKRLAGNKLYYSIWRNFVK